jgi:hypothetical protein
MAAGNSGRMQPDSAFALGKTVTDYPVSNHGALAANGTFFRHAGVPS